MPKQHDVIRHAHADGSQNLPATDDLTPNALETHLVECGEGQIGALRERAQQHLERATRELENQELTPVAGRRNLSRIQRRPSVGTAELPSGRSGVLFRAPLPP